MSRRSGQDPKLEIRNGKYTFRYRVDQPGVEERKQVRVVLGSVKQMTKCEAERRIKEFMVREGINIAAARIPPVLTFAQAVKNYRETFAPEMLRESTLRASNQYLKKHLEPDWSNVPVEHITITTVNEWARRKRKQGLSWTTIKNILRTMQRVLSASSKDNKPPFSMRGLVIPGTDKLRMRINGRNAVSFSWEHSQKIAEQVRELASLQDCDRERYATLFQLAAASGLRCSELLALKMDDLNFQVSTIRVDESVAPYTTKVGLCKNASAHRVVVLVDREGQEAMRVLKAFVGNRVQNPNALVFPSRRNTPLLESNLLRVALHPALKALSLPQAGMHAFRRGCNRRWELAGINPAILRQQMGHSSYAMTEKYTGEIPVEQVKRAIGHIIVTNVTRREFEAVA